MNKNTQVDDGYRVVFADATQDDRKNTNKEAQEKKGNIKKFRSFLFPAKYYDQTIQTAKELVKALKPNAEIIRFGDQGSEAFVYDRGFFNDIECGDAFVDFWDTVVKSNPGYADRVMKRLFRAISQTALKIEYFHKQEMDLGADLVSFFENAWNHDDNEKNYHKKFMKKLGELKILDNNQSTTMDVVYKKLCKDFPDLPWYAENICYHTFVRIHNKLDFGLLGVIPRYTLN